MPAALPALVLAAAAAPSMARLRDHRRVLVVAAPTVDDPRLRAQRAILAGWRGGAADRALTVVEVVGQGVSGVSGASGEAAAMRATYRLSPAVFTVVLIGKDGHVAYRSAAPIPADRLRRTIDAMPMRRAGQR